MSEKLSFVFDGQLAAENRMDFYESARFQYAASRLMVKLDNFRRKGDFPKKITYKNTPDILVLPARAGSFGISIIAPIAALATPLLLEVPLSALLSYVIDRVFKSADDDTIRESLRTQRDLIDVFEATVAGRDKTIDRTLELLAHRIDRADYLTDEVLSMQMRLIAEQQRRLELAEFGTQLRRITDEQSADIITMSAPLLKEMNVPLRRSARRLSIISTKNEQARNLLSADKAMADAVELAIVDRHVTRIDINVVQFNKQSGWGKFENEEWEGHPPFSVPGDLIEFIRETVVNAMHKPMVEVDCFFVRSPAGIPQRIIIIDIGDIKE